MSNNEKDFENTKNDVVEAKETTESDEVSKVEEIPETNEEEKPEEVNETSESEETVENNAEVNALVPICTGCGSKLEPNQAFCPKCGKKVVNDIPQNTLLTVEQKPKKNKKRKIIIGVVAVCLIGAAILVLFLFLGGRKDFNEMFSNYAGNTWCSIALDGSYINIDTNPDDTDEDYMTSDYYNNVMTPALNAIKRVNNELGFPESLYQKMQTTSALQGKQTESNEKYSVTWSYHPDKGLQVIYEFK